MKQARERGRSREAGGAPEVEGPALPADRAFVVQFRAGIGARRLIPADRVEHLASGRGRRFASWDELRTFVERILRAVGGAASTTEARRSGKGRG